jgi:hypothetical protein
MITILGEGKTVKYIGFTKKYLVVQCDCGAVWQAEKNNLKTIKQCRACFLKSSVGNLKHGGCRYPEYKSWAAARTRCNNPKNPKFKDYGDRGIKFCEEWNDFGTFITDMGRRPSPKHSIGRINNDGDYCKENCRWETSTEQARNKRNNIIVEIEGIKKPFVFWCQIFNKNYKKTYDKIRDGMDTIETLRMDGHGRDSRTTSVTRS